MSDTEDFNKAKRKQIQNLLNSPFDAIRVAVAMTNLKYFSEWILPQKKQNHEIHPRPSSTPAYQYQKYPSISFIAFLYSTATFLSSLAPFPVFLPSTVCLKAQKRMPVDTQKRDYGLDSEDMFYHPAVMNHGQLLRYPPRWLQGLTRNGSQTRPDRCPPSSPLI
ncbi:uncharacterized protein ARMOST_12541 [Armillaria ostoyae]|uniref:Uncharacterized protein n=1 Tax=Armillaria ostoyae TaxID=47428 RepID=A0A284RKA1_ARMOS|nr:uncharacterized protein ARMOST_12541 [Armillaria ostoyae]